MGWGGVGWGGVRWGEEGWEGGDYLSTWVIIKRGWYSYCFTHHCWLLFLSQETVCRVYSCCLLDFCFSTWFLSVSSIGWN